MQLKLKQDTIFYPVMHTTFILCSTILLMAQSVPPQKQDLNREDIIESSDILQKCIVLGCENRVKDKKWKDYRLSFGVVDLIAQNLYDSGIFTLLEEKPQIREKIKSFNDVLWKEGAAKVVPEAKNLFDSTALVVGRILYCGVPRTNISFGPLHANQSDIIIKTEVELIMPDGKKIVGQGQGKSTRSAISAMFEYRDDKVLFEQTNLGLALKEAIASSVSNLISQYSKEKKNGNR